MLTRYSIFNFYTSNNFFFSKDKNMFFIKGKLGTMMIYLPLFFFFKIGPKNISFLFLEEKFFFSFFAHVKNVLRNLSVFSYVRFRIKGIGHRIRKVSNFLYKFFFFSASYFYFYLPHNIIFKLKKKRVLMLSNDLAALKKILAHILLLKKVSAYRKRGMIISKQISFRKEGKRQF